MDENNNLLKMEKKKRQKRALDSLALCKKYDQNLVKGWTHFKAYSIFNLTKQFIEI